ncbi:MAG: response regulator [Woeseiaceae bacterium]
MSNRPNILFVDDEQRVLNSMRALFRREFDLFLTTNGAEAIKIAANNRIDVIVADQRMPGLSGIEVLDQVKRISPNTIRILLTGYADPAAVNDSINIGEVFRFLGKPCAPKVLRETLRLAVHATRPAAESVAPQLEPVQARRSPAGQTPEVTLDDTSSNELPVLRPLPLSNTKPNPQEMKQPSKEVGVVIYTVDSAFAETAIRTISNERSTLLATSLIRAMRALEEDSSGVLITDITTEFARLQRIISALKQCVPELVTVVVADSQDSNNMISLINYGQVFRYEQKPVAPNRLLQDIDAAAAKHINLRENPDMTHRHTVEDIPHNAFRPTVPIPPAAGANGGLRQENLRAIGGQL